MNFLKIFSVKKSAVIVTLGFFVLANFLSNVVHAKPKYSSEQLINGHGFTRNPKLTHMKNYIESLDNILDEDIKIASARELSMLTRRMTRAFGMAMRSRSRDKTLIETVALNSEAFVYRLADLRLEHMASGAFTESAAVASVETLASMLINISKLNPTKNPELIRLVRSDILIRFVNLIQFHGYAIRTSGLLSTLLSGTLSNVKSSSTQRLPLSRSEKSDIDSVLERLDDDSIDEESSTAANARPSLREFAYEKVGGFLQVESPKGYSLRRMNNSEKRVFLEEYKLSHSKMILVTGRINNEGDVAVTLYPGSIGRIYPARVLGNLGVLSYGKNGVRSMGHAFERTIELSDLIYVFASPSCREYME